MSDAVWVTLITAVAGVVGGIVGSVASPLGKDWVSRREFERTSEREDAARKREATYQAAQGQRLSAEREAAARHARISQTLQHMSDAMAGYDLEWRGRAPGNENVGGEALKAAAAAWTASRAIVDAQARELVDRWREAFAGADMKYRSGAEPPGRQDLLSLYKTAAEVLGALLMV